MNGGEKCRARDNQNQSLSPENERTNRRKNDWLRTRRGKRELKKENANVTEVISDFHPPEDIRAYWTEESNLLSKTPPPFYLLFLLLFFFSYSVFSFVVDAKVARGKKETGISRGTSVEPTFWFVDSSEYLGGQCGLVRKDQNWCSESLSDIMLLRGGGTLHGTVEMMEMIADHVPLVFLSTRPRMFRPFRCKYVHKAVGREPIHRCK